ncbi:hypothetical protein D3C72_1888860 [compost metagenome]
MSRMLPNCSLVCSRVLPITLALSCWPRTAGRPPSWPEATWTFCALMAVLTSSGVSW